MIFLVDEGREDSKATKSEISFKWCFASGSMMAQQD